MAQGDVGARGPCHFLGLGIISNETVILASATFATWPFLIVWFLSRPTNKVLVFGPQGQQVSVSEREGKRRVDRGDGWTYEPVPRPS
jgi:hypothetical protein